MVKKHIPKVKQNLIDLQSYKQRLNNWLASHTAKWFEHYKKPQGITEALRARHVRPDGTYYFLPCGLGIFCDTLMQSHNVSVRDLKR